MVYNGNKKFIYDNYLLCAMDLKPVDIDNISEGNECLMEYKKDLEKINNDEDFVKWISAEKEAEMFENTRILIAEEKGIEQERIEIAKKMINENMDESLIIKLTGLSKDELSKLYK